jgi:hypothetical protein
VRNAKRLAILSADVGVWDCGVPTSEQVTVPLPDKDRSARSASPVGQLAYMPVQDCKHPAAGLAHTRVGWLCAAVNAKGDSMLGGLTNLERSGHPFRCEDAQVVF